jgi:hypothetical protein
VSAELAHDVLCPDPRLGLMNSRLIIGLLCAGALAFACGPRSRTQTPPALASAMPLQVPKAEPVSPASHGRKHDSAVAKGEAKIDSKLDVAIARNEVRLAFNVRNVGNKHAELLFPSGQSYDFAIVDSVGREVWRWSTHRMFTSGVQNKELGTGDVMELAETWKATAKPGKYTAIATLKSSNFPVEQHVDFVMH